MEKKLRLDVDALEVTSFEAEGAADEAGTVDGYQLATRYQTCYCSGQNTCQSCDSCQNSTAVGNCFCTECASCWCDEA